MDALPDGGADARVGARAREPAARRLLQPDRVARLVPGRPVLHRGQVRLVEVVGVRDVVAAVARGSCVREVLQVVVVVRRHVPRLPAVGPRRREQDRQQTLHPELRCVPNRAVVDRPVVRRVGGILRMRRTTLGHVVPVQVDAHDLGAQLLHRRERELRIAVQRHRIVLDADEHVRLGRGGRHAQTRSGEQKRRQDPDAATQRPAPVQSWAACGGGLPRAEPPAPS